MASAKPSTFVRLLDVMSSSRQVLLEDISNHDFRHLDRLPRSIADAVRPHLRTTEQRIGELRRALSASAPTFKNVWPELRLVTTWTGGSCRIALSGIRDSFPNHTQIAELGYLSSEFRGTITVDL